MQGMARPFVKYTVKKRTLCGSPKKSIHQSHQHGETEAEYFLDVHYCRDRENDMIC